MSLGIRVKLFLAFFYFIVTGLAVTGFVLSHFLKENIENRTRDELLSLAKTTRLLLESRHGPLDEVSGDALADRAGAAASLRVTLIREDGTVFGDSEFTLAQVRELENHGNRQEIIEASAHGSGTSTRFSTTLECDMMYVGVEYKAHGERGTVRVSKPLTEVKTTVSGLRRILLYACLVGLIIAALMSAVTSHLISRRLRALLRSAKQLVRGENLSRIEEGPSDELGGLAMSLNDLSDKVEEYVAQLAEKRDLFEAVLDGMSEAVIALDEKSHVTLINRAGTMLLGITDRPTGRMLLETVRIPELYELAADAAESTGKTKEFDLHSPPTRRILARATPLQRGGVVIVLVDVTELRRLERIRRDFVSNVSHELRTPVSIIQANAETLRDGAIEDPEASERFLGAVIAGAKRLTSIISDLLDISRLEEGKFELLTEAIPVGAALHRAAAALETKAIERNFSIKTSPCPEVTVKADSRALDQVLFNLVDNAVKYAGQGGIVVLRAREFEGRIRIEVEDNGPGIEPRYRDRLFERFFRVDKGRSREMGGTGLGLAIVKHLASAMRGDVGMTPASPHGAIFWIVLDKA